MNHWSKETREAIDECTRLREAYTGKPGREKDMFEDIPFLEVKLTKPIDQMLWEAGQAYDPERHDPDSIFFDDSYVGPSERSLNGGCNRCGGWDDCYCNG